MSDTIRIPVTVGFDSSKIVGVLELRMDALPPTTDWCLALGFNDLGEGKYAPMDVSIVTDAGYLAYLQAQQS